MIQDKAIKGDLRMRKITLSVVLATLALTLGLAGNATAYTWYSYEGHEYASTPTPGGWTMAEVEAMSVGGHLVAINDAAEQTWLFNNFTFTFLCIGLERVADNWGWTSGEPVTYTNWHLNYPIALGANYGYMVFGYGGEWFNDDVSLFSGIIERPVPLPSALLLLSSGLAGLAAWRRRRG